MDFVRKHIKLLGVVALIVVISVSGYYVLKLKQGKYPASAFKSIVIKWGVGNQLWSSYNSTTGIYQYLDGKDRLVKKSFKLHSNEIIYLHNRLITDGFWTLPKVIANKNANLKDEHIFRIEIEVSYDEETKNIIYLSNYDEDVSVAQQVEMLQKSIIQTINEAEDRYSN